MKKRTLLVLTAVALSVVFLFAVVYATPQAADVMTMDSKVYKKHKKTLVNFSHKKHNVDYKIGCTDCHHIYKEGKNVWKEGDAVKKCSECHNPVKEEAEGLALKKAFHDNCKKCHKEAELNGNMNAPTMKCTGCHAKK